MSNLDDLRKRGLIERVEPDQATATGWHEDFGRHLNAGVAKPNLGHPRNYGFF